MARDEQLFAGYGIDPAITAVVDEHEIWVVPVWNPDGYDYVFSTDNLWRRNRRPVDGAVGVDLNRKRMRIGISSCELAEQVGGALGPGSRARSPGRAERDPPRTSGVGRRRMAAMASTEVHAPSLSDEPPRTAVLRDAAVAAYPNPNRSCGVVLGDGGGGAFRRPSCPRPCSASTRAMASGSVATSTHFMAPPQRLQVLTSTSQTWRNSHAQGRRLLERCCSSLSSNPRASCPAASSSRGLWIASGGSGTTSLRCDE